MIKQTAVRSLRWSERYLKTDMVYLTTGGFWLLLGQAINFVGSLLLVWIFANVLPKEIYGEYRFFIAVAGVLSLTALPGINIAIVHSVARGYGATFNTALRARILWSLFGSSGALLAAGYYFWNANLHLAALFVIVALCIPFFDTFSSYVFYLRGHSDFRLSTLMRSFQRVVVIIGTGASVLLSGNIFVILLTYMGLSSLIDVILVRVARRAYPTGDKHDTEAIAYGKHLSLVNALQSAVRYFDKILLWYVAGPAQLAIYAIAVAVPQEIFGALGHVGRLALPRMSVRAQHELKQTLLRKIGIFFLGLLPIIGLYIYLAPLLFSLFFSQYQEAVVYTQLASLTLLFSPSILFMQYFYATKYTRAIHIMNMVEPITLIALYAILVPTLGVLGVIYATLIKAAFGCVLTFFFFWTDRRVD